MHSPEQWKRYSRKRRAILDSLKNHPCMDCKGVYPPYVMDWDHRPNEIKSFNIGQQRSKPLKAIIKDIAKCDLVCVNCHRVRTYKRRKF